MKTIIYVGHLSKFGRAFIREIPANDFFKVGTIVLADYKRCLRFQRALVRIKQLPDEKDFKRAYHRYLREIRAMIPANVAIRIVSNVNTTSEYQALQDFDLALTAAFPQIFSTAFIQAAKKQVINFHPSYLPRCRGANPIYWAIAKREPFAGLSSHFVTVQIDAGPIVARCKIDIDINQETYNGLYEKVLKRIPEVIEETANFFHNNKTYMEQDESEASYFRHNIKIDHKLFWSTESSSEIMAKIRAGWGYSHISSGREIILVPPTVFHTNLPQLTGNSGPSLPSGCLIQFDQHRIWIKAGDGYIETHYKFRKQLADIISWALEKVGLGKWRSRIALLSGDVLKVGEILR